MVTEFKVGDLVIMKARPDGYSLGVPKEYLGKPGTITAINEGSYLLRLDRQPHSIVHDGGYYRPRVSLDMLEHAEGPW